MSLLQEAKEKVEKEKIAYLFGYYVKDPERYGVVEYDANSKVVSIEEKPKNPKSNYAAIGLYFYPNNVIEIAKNISPSDRGELEITSVNEEYLKKDNIYVSPLGRGYAWFDTGTHDSLLDASNFIATIEKRQGLKIACLEEIAYSMGYISQDDLLEIANTLKKSTYGQYLSDIIGRRIIKEQFIER